MIRTRQGRVAKITAVSRQLTEVIVAIQGEAERKAYNYDLLTGPVEVGDVVVLNTTAVAKSLGTGGAHFIMANLTRPDKDYNEAGHIMKLRYSPCQVKVLAAEESDSPWAEVINSVDTLAGTPVVVGTLHSMVAPAAAGIKATAGAGARVAYIMTDGAALPLSLSNLVRDLKAAGLLDVTITCGHAFGGDLETINIYTALQAAVAAGRADVIIVAMGPGIVGAASKFGFTGVEQGEIINAVNILGGAPIAIPRLSFADQRDRHRGLSHHSRTALGVIALSPATVVLPVLHDADQAELISEQIASARLAAKHRIVEEDGTPALSTLAAHGLKVTSMGRSVEQDPAFFLAAGAAGAYAGKVAVSRTGNG